MKKELRKTFEKFISLPEMKIKFTDKATERIEIKNANEAASLFYSIENMEDNMEHHEMFYAAYMNQSGKVMGVMKIAEGGIDSTAVDTRIIMQGGLLLNASSIILCHNHPSRNTRPSTDDLDMTKRLKSAAEILKMRVLDHIIISKDNYTSMAEEGVF